MREIIFGTAGIPMAVKGRGSAEGVREIDRLGLGAMEVEFVRGVKMGLTRARKLGEVARGLGVRLSVHAPYFVNLCSRNPGVREKSRGWLVECARLGACFDASVVVFHPGVGPVDDVRSERFQSMVEENCSEVVDRMRSGGAFVPLGLETSGRDFQFGTVEQIQTVNRNVPGTTVVVDFAHLHAYRQGCLDSPEAFGSLLDSLEPGPLHAHFTGIHYDAHGERHHLPVGEGGPRFDHLAEALKHRDREVTLICESPLLEVDALRMKKVWERCRW